MRAAGPAAVAGARGVLDGVEEAADGVAGRGGRHGAGREVRVGREEAGEPLAYVGGMGGDGSDPEWMCEGGTRSAGQSQPLSRGGGRRRFPRRGRTMVRNAVSLRTSHILGVADDDVDIKASAGDAACFFTQEAPLHR